MYLHTCNTTLLYTVTHAKHHQLMELYPLDLPHVFFFPVMQGIIGFPCLHVLHVIYQPLTQVFHCISKVEK